MSGYNELKNAIRRVVKTNNNREITGQNLQSTLTSMVNSLGANYHFAGFASPDTNPGTPDQNIFYIASEEGTYVNFDGINLEPGLSFLMWNGKWSSETISVGEVTKSWVQQNYVSIAFFNELFELYNDSTKIAVNDTVPVDKTKLNIKAMFGFWTEQYISALGKNDSGGSGSGVDMATVWSALAGSTDEQINESHLTTALSGYATMSWVSQIFATITSIPTKLSQLANDTGFITSAALPTKLSQLTNDTGFITSAALPTKVSQLVNDAGYVTASIVNGYATQSWVSQNYVSVEFFERLFQVYSGTTKVDTNSTSAIDNIKAMFGFWTEQYISALGKNDSGGSGSGVDMATVWSALAGSTDEQINESHLTTVLSEYATQSWVSQIFATITSIPTKLSQLANDTGFITSAALPTKVSQLVNDAGYVTEDWVEGKGYLTNRDAYTKEEIDAKDWSSNKGTVTSVGITMPTGFSVSGSPITEKGILAIGFATGYSLPTTAKQSNWDTVYNWYSGITGSDTDTIINKWGEIISFLDGIEDTATLSGIVNGINQSITAESNRAKAEERSLSKSITDEASRAKAAEQTLTSSISTNTSAINVLNGYFTNGVAKSAVKLQTARKIWGNNFDGTGNVSGNMTDVGTVNNVANIQKGTSTVAYLHVTSASAYIDYVELHCSNLDNSRKDRPLVLQYGYGNVGIGVAQPSCRLDVNGTFYASGNSSIGGTLGVTGATTILSTLGVSGAATLSSTLSVTDLLTASGGITIPSGKTLTIGDAVLSWDSTNQAIKITKGLYSETFISALGANSSSGSGGVDMDMVWSALANKTSEQINASHLTTALSGYATQSWVYQQLTGGTVTTVKVGTTTYNPTDGVVSLPAYPNVPTNVSQLTNDSGFVTSSGVTSVATGTGLTGGTITSTGNISINSTYQTYISHGESAYNSLGNYLLKSGGELSGNIYRKYSASDVSPFLWVNSGNYDNYIWAVSDSASTYTSFGFGLKYIGTGSGNENKLVLYADNQLGTKVAAYSVLNNGEITFAVTPKVGTSTIITSGSIGSQSVNYATSAGSVAWANVSDRPTNVSAFTNDSGYITSSASITGNAGSATKLQTARTIWGQSFDGSANVSGNMTGVGFINSVLGFGGASNAKLIITEVGSMINYIDLHVESYTGEYQHERPLVLQNGYGNVGIGVAQPSYKLDVDGDVRATNFRGTLIGNADTATSATNAGNADTVDNEHASDFVHITGSTMSGDLLVSKTAGNKPSIGVKQEGCGDIFLASGSSSKNRGLYNSDAGLGWLCGWDSSNNGFFNGNATSATTAVTASKLSTVSKTAWGQTYWTDGGIPATISGAMSGVTSINGTVSFPTGTSSNPVLNIQRVYAATDYMSVWVTATHRPLVLQLNAGNVGIGVAQPSYKLDVSGVIHSTTGIFSDGYVKANSFAKKDSSDSYVLLGGGGHSLISSLSVASATKLQTARTIWGQSFDGTSNVDGNLSCNGQGSFNSLQIGNITIIYDAANKGLRIAGGGLYTDSYLSSLGIDASTALSVKKWADSINLTEESDAELATAYSIGNLYRLINSNQESITQSLNQSVSALQGRCTSLEQRVSALENKVNK